jgi:NADH-quinone oxidoreductase subunit G
MAYGVDFSRYREPKRAAVKINLGPLVETEMTRCISCTRCVRFITEVAGVPEMGQTGRGEDSEIVSYLDAALTSELQGNVVDLCPVGALTNKPYAFTARPWELTKTQSIDVMDALGSNIRIDVRGREVMRILPRNHDGVNEEWLADRSRYIWDGLRRQRLDQPYVRTGGKLKPASWGEAFGAVAAAVKQAGEDIAAVSGDLVPVEAVWALKGLIDSLGSDRYDCRQDGAALPAGNRSGYVGNASIEDIDSARRILIVGANPRAEAPVLNARLRKAWMNGAEFALVGEAVDLTYPYTHVGPGSEALQEVIDMGGESIVEHASLVIVGQGALRRPDGAAVLAAAQKVAEQTASKLLVLHTAAGRVGAMDVGFTHDGGAAGALDGAKLVFNLGADEIDMPEGAFVVYQGSHGDRGAHRADVILPGAAYTEQSGIFVNTEGRPQMAARAGFPPGDAREDWAILRALSAELGQTLAFNSLAELRAGLFEAHPHLGALDQVPVNEWTKLKAGKMRKAPFAQAVADHYLVNPVCRASEVMAELSRLAAERNRAIAAE